MGLRVGWSRGRCLERPGIPCPLQVAPAFGFFRSGVQALEERLIAVVRSLRGSLADDGCRHVDGWNRCAGMCLPDELDIVAQDAGLDVVGADHVVGHEQEFLAGKPVIVLLDDWGQLNDSASSRVALKNQVKHGHVVTLAAAEAAMEKRGLAGAVGHCVRIIDRAASKQVVSSGVTT